MKHFASVLELQIWLNDNGIDTLLWGKDGAKQVVDLWDELVGGETAVTSPPPLRLVHVTQLHIRKGDQLLLEVAQELKDGQRRSRNRPPSEKMKPGESYKETAVRCLQEEIGIPAEAITLLPATHKQTQKERNSPSYPGLLTQYTFHTVEAQIEGLPDQDFWRDNQAHGSGDPVKRHLWGWRKKTQGFSL